MRTVQLGSPLLVAWYSFCNYVVMPSSRNLSVQIFGGGEMTAALYGSKPVVSGERGQVRGGTDQGREGEGKERRIQRG